MNKPEHLLKSDGRNREDLCKLVEGNVDEAQAKKEELEDYQRRDAKLRETHAKSQ